MATNRFTTFKLTGGEDRVTPSLDIPNGVARNLLNYEQDYNSGYTRIGGYRHLVVGTVPGEGAILGTVIYNDNVYIFRNKTGSIVAGMWKAIPAVYDDTVSPATVVSNGSWTEVTDIIDKDSVATTLNPDGYYQFTIHNFKATAKDVGQYVGDWTGATNYFVGDIINDSAGVLGAVDLKYLTDEEHKSSGSLLSDTAFWHLLDWTTDASPDDAHNISGDSGYLYGVDGQNPAWQFDGTQLKQINSTYTPDTPQHIEANGNRLVLGFRAGEIAISELGNPEGFDPVLGAGSLGVTDFLTGMMAGPDGVLYIFAKDKIYLYKGMNGPLAQTELVKHNKNVGAYPYSNQMLAGKALFYDNWGITNLEVTDRYGDVITATLSNSIQNILTGLKPVTSIVRKDRAQYRLYLETQTGTSSSTTCLIVTFISEEERGITHAVYPFQIATADSAEINTSTVSLVGTATGDVFQMDVGTNFNGDSYLSYMILPYNNLGTSNRVKKLRKIRVHITAIDELELLGRVSFDEGDNAIPYDTDVSTLMPSGSDWDNAVWGNFIWNAGASPYAEYYFNGHFNEVSLVLQHDSALTRPHIFKDITYIYQDQRIEH